MFRNKVHLFKTIFKAIFESPPPLLLPGLVSSSWGSIKSSLADCGTLFICVLNYSCVLGYLGKSQLLWGFLFSASGLHVYLQFVFQSTPHKIWHLYDTKLFRCPVITNAEISNPNIITLFKLSSNIA